MKIYRLIGVASVLVLSLPICGFSGGLAGCFGSSTPTLMSVHSVDATYKNGVRVGATPRPAQQVWGQWQFDNSGATGSVESFGFNSPAYTGTNGRYDVTNARLNATWQFQTEFNPACNQTYPVPATITLYTPPEAEVTTSAHDPYFECATEIYDAAVSPSFMMANSLPSTITVQALAQAVSTGSGTPQLYVYDRGGNLVSTIAASSFDSTSATFSTSSLSSLSPDMYGVAMVNNSFGSGSNYLGHGYFSIGKNGPGSYATPFGVDAITYTEVGTICNPGRGHNCSSVATTVQYPIVTLYNSAQAVADGILFNVGSHPTVVRAYNKATTTKTDPYGGLLHITQQNNALVVNTASNSVSILDLNHNNVVATIAVGTTPVDARVTPDNSTAYVVNYGSGTLSKISLSSYTVTATANVGSQPTSLDLDSSGDPVVGGNGYVVTLNPSSLTPISTQSVSGVVTAVAFSAGEGKTLTALATGQQGGPSGQMKIVGTNVSNNSQAFSTGPISTSGFGNSGISSSLAYPNETASGILVSPIVNGGFAATATPTGFVITDVDTGATVLSANTPSAVRGMAIDPTAGYFYFTMPDLNEVITVPIPSTPDPGTMQALN